MNATIQELNRITEIKKAIFDDQDAAIRIRIKDIEESIIEKNKKRLLNKEKSIEERIIEQMLEKR